MIVVKLIGGLGNQMFQYAFGKALSLKYGDKVLYDVSWYHNKSILTEEEKIGIYRRLALHHFNVQLDKEIPSSSIKHFLKWSLRGIHKRIPFLSKITKYVVYDETFRKLDQKYHPDVWNINANNIYFIGFWQSEEYFAKYHSEIIHDFQIITPQSEKNRVWSKKILNCNSISLHIRRGDYSLENTLEKEYYSKAIEYVLKHVENPVFFIFSDDIPWVKNNIKIPYEVHYMEQNNQAEAYEDMRLMSQCKHNIIANSTFSWWGAWLNQNPMKIVVAPNRWLVGINLDDIIPKMWIRL